MKAILALDDGNYFEGEAFEAERECQGEVCFNTSMTGYQEILTDPSYAGQIVTLTYPEIGNYGVNLEDVESKGIQVRGLVVKHACEFPSNWRAGQDGGRIISLARYLADNGVPGIQGVDTRRLVRILRESGARNGLIAVGEHRLEDVLARARAVPSLSADDFVRKVTIPAKQGWEEGEHPLSFRPAGEPSDELLIVAIDYGAKYNILRKLRSQGARVVRLPATATAEEILALNPDGIFLSNGPGDPEVLDYAVEAIRRVLGRAPVFGICLGHQLIARALGGKTYKLKFGHRGANHPVKDLRTGKVEITSQNHGFAVAPDSLDPAQVEITHINLNDNTVAGLRHKSLPVFSVQYHPEASPGPKDSHYLFEEYVRQLRAAKAMRSAVPAGSR